MGKGKTQLTEKWLTHELYKSWVRKGQTLYAARCSICKKEVNVQNGVEDALKKHANGKGHKDLIQECAIRITDFLGPSSSSSTASTTAITTTTTTTAATRPVSTSSSSTLIPSGDKDLVVKAEIKSALRIVKHHSSFNSCVDLGEHYQDIFSDSQTASNFTFGKTKCMYIIKFGISPWVVESVNNAMSSSPFYSISFDDSHNSVLEMEQMDIQVRYWCPMNNITKTRYLGSQFQYSTTAEALVEELLQALPSSPKLDKMTQLAMDGPSTNWKVLDLMNKFREKEEMPPMNCIGSCGLHIVSGALGTGVKKADWSVEKVLRGMFKFLKKAPARRGDYLQLSVTCIFPLQFIATRWTENDIVAERGVTIWDDIVKLIKFTLGKTKSKQPKDNKSYDNLVKYHTNPLIKVELHLFKDVAFILNRFLVTFQTDNPMVPFLSMEISSVLKSLMRFFMPKAILQKLTSSYLVHKVDVEDKNNLVLDADIKLTTAAAAELIKNVPKNLHCGLKKSFRTMLQALIKKIQERSPVNYKLVRQSACLNPVNLAVLNQEALQNMFDGVVTIMYTNKRISSVNADKAKEQFDKFLTTEVKANKTDFKSFDFKKTRTDEFLKSITNGGKTYPEMWRVCIFVFTLSHGQSSVERGFNINKEALKFNLDGATLVALRTCYDQLLASGNQIKSFPISKELIVSCKLASRRYKDELERKKQDTGKVERERKRKLVNDEILTVKKTKLDEENLVRELEAEGDSLFKQAAQNGVTVEQMRLLVVKGQSLKDSAKKKENVVADLAVTLENMNKELKKM